MRTQRRPLALAASFATAIIGVGLLAGVQPAAAAAQDTSAAVSDCAGNSIGSNGILDPGLLQQCLDQVQSSLAFEADAPADEAPLDEAPLASSDDGEADYYAEVASFDALDVVFQVDVPAFDTVEPAVEKAAPAAAGPSDAFVALAECESGGNYSINTGNGYYGAYQFSLATWQSLGYEGYPHEASPAVQDQAAAELQAQSGWGQWPGCSWYLGLG
jgi:hypothetical protein